MTEMVQSNLAKLSGYLEDNFTYSHHNHGGSFYKATVVSKRLSGKEDKIQVIASHLFVPYELVIKGKGARVWVEGRFSSRNVLGEDGKNHVELFLFAKTNVIEFEDGEEQETNEVLLQGTICKKPTFRMTPMGKEISDIILAVQRPYGRSDYLPCIAWGSLARKISQEMSVGDKLQVRGRMQSRTYLKRDPLNFDKVEERTTYEISIMDLIE